VSRDEEGELKVTYGSGLDILRQTPEFVAETMRLPRRGFGGAYRFGTAVRRSQSYVKAIDATSPPEAGAQTQRWSMLRQSRHCFTWEKNPLRTCVHSSSVT
jgi:hypothetical protein